MGLGLGMPFYHTHARTCTHIDTQTPLPRLTGGNTQDGDDDKALAVGLGVGLGVGIPVIIAAVGTFLWMRRRKSAGTADASSSKYAAQAGNNGDLEHGKGPPPSVGRSAATTGSHVLGAEGSNVAMAYADGRAITFDTLTHGPGMGGTLDGAGMWSMIDRCVDTRVHVCVHVRVCVWGGVLVGAELHRHARHWRPRQLLGPGDRSQPGPAWHATSMACEASFLPT